MQQSIENRIFLLFEQCQIYQMIRRMNSNVAFLYHCTHRALLYDFANLYGGRLMGIVGID